MPTHDVSARYAIAIAAPPAQVYAALLSTDFTRPWVVRALAGVRLLPGLILSPGSTWRRLTRPARHSLQELDRSDFILLEQRPPREIVLGISGRFWTLAPAVERIPPARFRDPLPNGLAQAAWSFEITETGAGVLLATETRIRSADPITLRRFRRYWRLVAPGSGLIRRAILGQIRREAMAGVR